MIRYAQEKLMKWILTLEFDHFAIPKPDLNIFLDVPFSFTEKKLLSNKVGQMTGLTLTEQGIFTKRA